ncbi:Harbinger transposase-derived protein [Arabidopsis suecica]|uniref:Harbinger transposase-derived protein n=1 Tax=Arabidopsis suecica TaxID=45249 RepID=A0A8T2CL40_ARASU|nr:Harbinger transposase-derived protein [Arabidopsis suecica]
MSSYIPFSHSSSYLELLNSQQESLNQEIPTWSSQQSQDAPLSQETPVRKDRKKLNPADDEVLISAWLNTSKDPIIGNQQKAGSFWQRVGEYYAESPHAIANGEQGLNINCKQRWFKINDFTNKFCGAYATAERSNVFDDILNGKAPEVNFFVNGREYNLAYYLTDGIYPKWATFIPSVRLPQGMKNSLFSRKQEAVRKDVERAFGVLQARFAVVKNPSPLWDKKKIANVMRACIILHNMIVEDERGTYSYRNIVSEFQHGENVDQTYTVGAASLGSNISSTITRRTRIRDKQAHQQLKEDLVEHIWTNFGHLPDNED